MLLDKAPHIESYTKLGELNDTLLYTFPFSNQNGGGTVTLYCVKMEIFCELVSSNEEDSPVGYDCFFEITQLNRSVFEK